MTTTSWRPTRPRRKRTRTPTRPPPRAPSGAPRRGGRRRRGAALARRRRGRSRPHPQGSTRHRRGRGRGRGRGAGRAGRSGRSPAAQARRRAAVPELLPSRPSHRTGLPCRRRQLPDLPLIAMAAADDPIRVEVERALHAAGRNGDRPPAGHGPGRSALHRSQDGRRATAVRRAGGARAVRVRSSSVRDRPPSSRRVPQLRRRPWTCRPRPLLDTSPTNFRSRSTRAWQPARSSPGCRR